MAIKNSQQFSELEYCITRYFSSTIRPIMASTERNLDDKRMEEQKEYNNSFAGILRSFTDETHSAMGVDSSTAYLQTVGKWNSKTTDDYLDMVRNQIADDKTIQKDLSVLAREWRKAVIDEVGRDAYDSASRQLGGDLSYAYIEYRLEQQMIDHLTAERVPQSSLEYIMRKAADHSLFGMVTTMRKTATDYYIEEKTEALYKPTVVEKGVARVAAVGADSLATAGIGSWSSLAKMAGAEVVFAGIESYVNNRQEGQKPLSVEQCISQGLFGSSENLFSGFRERASGIKTWEHPTIVSLNHELGKKMAIMEKPPIINTDFNPEGLEYPLKWNDTSQSQTDRSDIPSFIAFGKEEEYRTARKKQEQENKEKKEESASSKTEQKAETQQAAEEPQTHLSSAATQENNLSGWQALTSQFDMTDLSKVGSNLGYVIAMLPDVLLGALTGKSANLSLDKNLIPIATVLMGIFVKNPLLKMLLLGLGGGTLLNKAGHEALNAVQEQLPKVKPTYRRYADEPLNPRVVNPEIKSGTLLCTIDRVSCAIALPTAVLDAYEQGALPLNKLANAVLAKHDESRQTFDENLQRQYDETARQHNNNQGIR